MNRRILILAASLCLASPAHAQMPDPFKVPEHAEAKAKLQGLTEAEAAKLIETLADAQQKMSASKAVFFELLAGAPASYDVNKIAPRDIFLKMRFDKAWKIERFAPGTKARQLYRFSIAPNGLGKLYWDVEIGTTGKDGKLDMVKMVYRPPAPY